MFKTRTKIAMFSYIPFRCSVLRRVKPQKTMSPIRLYAAHKRGVSHGSLNLSSSPLTTASSLLLCRNIPTDFSPPPYTSFP